MHLQVPISVEIQKDLRDMFSSLAKSVIEDVKEKDALAKDYLTIKETCKYLCITFATLQKWESLGLKSIKIEGKKIFSKKTIDEFVKIYED